MDNFPKISIPVPCHENWNNMSVASNGRFCASCAKNVIDFSGKSREEIQQFVFENQGKEVCGRFRTDQIEGLKILIPESVFYRKMAFHRAFLLALFVTMGSILFSCSDDDGSKQSIDSVEITSEDYSHMTTGVMIMPTYNVAEESEEPEYQPWMYEDAADYDWEADTVATAAIDSVATEDFFIADDASPISAIPEPEK